MIGYCPLDELDPSPVHKAAPVEDVKSAPPKSSILGAEDTECNYVILAFIVGVLLLAIGDLRN